METFDYLFDNGKKVHLPPPTVEAYYQIYHALNDSEKVEGLCEWLAGGSPEARAYIQPIDMVPLRSLPNYLTCPSILC